MLVVKYIGGITMKSKKLLSLIMCVLLCVFGVLNASAASVTYSAGKTGITLSLPESMSVFTREISPDAGEISDILGMTYENLMSKYQLENIYLEAINPDTFENIVVTSCASSEKNYYDMTQDELNAIVTKEKNAYMSTGSVDSAELYKSASGTNFVKIAKNADSANLIYVTVYNGNRITIKYTNFSSEITSGQESGFKAVIDSAKFPEKVSDVEDGASTDTTEPKEDEKDETESKSLESDLTSDENEEITKQKEASSDLTEESSSDTQKSEGADKLVVKNLLLIVLGAIVIVLVLVVVFGRKSGGKKRRR